MIMLKGKVSSKRNTGPPTGKKPLEGKRDKDHKQLESNGY